MKEFDDEIKKLKLLQKIKSDKNHSHRQHRFNTQILNKTVVDLKSLHDIKKKETSPLSNSYIPDIFMKKLPSQQRYVSQSKFKEFESPKSAIKNTFLLDRRNLTTKALEKSLSIQRSHIVGKKLTSEEKFLKLYAVHSQVHSPQPLDILQPLEQQDSQIQTARFSYKHQQTTSLKHQNTTFYANQSSNSGNAIQKLNPKYSRKDTIGERIKVSKDTENQ